jgi:TctA family transporter
MVVEGRTTNAALLRYRAGIALIWVGVLIWLPFILLRANGLKPSLFWFLPFHLVGVIGGSRLRKTAREEMGANAPKKNAFRTIGHGLIFLGIMGWSVYFYLKMVAGQPVDVGDFLPYHLTGIFGGIGFLGMGYFVNRKSASIDG